MRDKLRDNADAVLEHTADPYGSPLQKYQNLLTVAKLKGVDAPTPQELARLSRHSVKFPTALRWRYGYYETKDEASDASDEDKEEDEEGKEGEEDGSDEEEDEDEEGEEGEEDGSDEEGEEGEEDGSDEEGEEDKRNTALLRTLVRTKTWKELGVLMLVDFDEEDIARSFKWASKEGKAERESEVRRWNLHLVTLWMLAQRLEHVLEEEEFSKFNTEVKNSMEKKKRMADMLDEPDKWQEFARWIQTLAEKRLAMKMPA